MPAKDAHLDQAKHNQAFASSIDRAKYSDWASTALFYAALHYVDAFLATMSINPGSHDMRDRLINSTKELKPIANHYWKLKNSSRNARYYPPTRFSPKQITELESVHLAQIKTSLGF